MSGWMSLSEAFDAAVHHHQAGRLDEAETIYRQILQSQPDAAHALYLLGRLEHERGRHQGAAELLARAIAAHALDPTYHRTLGEALAAQDKLDEAERAFREAIRLKPDYELAHNSLGRALLARGDLAAAESCFREALRTKPGFFEALNNLGILLSRRGNFSESRQCLAAAVRARPDSPLAHANLGQALQREGLFAEAIEPYRRALQLNPRDAAAHFKLAVSLQQVGRYKEALAELREAAQLDPRQAAVYLVAGYLWNQLGDADQAIGACQKAIELDPRLAEAYCNLGQVYQAIGRLDEAIASFRQALELDPAALAAHENLLYAMNFHPGCSSEQIFAEHRAWAARHANPLAPADPAFDNDRDPQRRLRIGYVSAHFRGHAVNSFVEPILAAHDPAACEVFCYSNLVAARDDETTARLRGYVHHWREIAHLDDQQVWRLVRDDRIDILVDLAGHIEGNRLLVFARRAAPLQVTYIGYQNTTGMAAMDYRLSDAWSDPPGTTERYYTEQLVRLPETFFCYMPPDEAPPASPPPALAAGHVTFGSFNNFAKVTPQVLDTWARLLAAVPNSRMILLAPRCESLAARALGAFERQGVARDRVRIVPRQPFREYLRLIGTADVALDAFPFNGHTTTCDALWMGLPVVMLAGDSYASRFGASALVNLGLADHIASTTDQYVKIAAELAADIQRLAALRAELRARMAASVLVDGPRFARHLEAAYREMWRRWCSHG